MDEVQNEFLDIVAQVRSHLEYQKALGVKAIVVPPAEHRAAAGSSAAAPASPPQHGVRTSIPPVAAEETASTPSLPVTLPSISEEIGDCRRCKLFNGRKNIVFGEGDPEAAIMFVGEGPGYEEDQQGRPFVGAAGQLLTDIIEKGMRIKRADVYICNIVKCRPPNNRNPEPDEVEACIGFVKKQIRAIKPKVIVTLGNVPTQNLLGTKQGITRMRGAWQVYEGIPVMPTFHPSYLLRSPGEKKKVWEDIQLVMAKIGLPVQAKKSEARSQESGETP